MIHNIYIEKNSLKQNGRLLSTQGDCVQATLIFSQHDKMKQTNNLNNVLPIVWCSQSDDYMDQENHIYVPNMKVSKYKSVLHF
jgi:hypothetical protein